MKILIFKQLAKRRKKKPNPYSDMPDKKKNDYVAHPNTEDQSAKSEYANKPINTEEKSTTSEYANKPDNPKKSTTSEYANKPNNTEDKSIAYANIDKQ